MKSIVVILHNIRSSQNVGAIFRTADGVGASSIYLTGYTPTPIDRFGRQRSALIKTALGAEKTITWKQDKSVQAVIDELRTEGYTIYAAEQNKRAHKYTEIKYQSKMAFIFGNEVSGLEEDVLSESDYIVEIPMYGAKESLNVSVAAGIVLFNAQQS